MDNLIINNVNYEHVRTRVYTPVSIYKANRTFLRIGPEELVRPELELHKKLIQYRFPVPQILEEGQHEGLYFYIEQSLGERLYGDLFWDDCKSGNGISNQNFQGFLKISLQFAEAQLSTASSDHDSLQFYKGLHLHHLVDELPELKSEIGKVFQIITQQIQPLPNVLTHGDLGPYNILPNGVIDFGSSFYAPAGYDLVGSLFHTYNFPDSEKYEFNRRFWFSTSQIQEYFNDLDKLYANNGLPKLSEHSEMFVLAKLMWSATRMDRWPDIQNWRYKLMKRAISAFLEGKSVIKLVIAEE